MKRLAALIVLTACTPHEVRVWQHWHDADPQAAEEFANQPNIQAQLQSGPGIESEPSGTLPSLTPGTLPPVAEIVRGVWDRLAACESGERWSYNGRSGYDGGLQFAPSTWRAVGGTDFAPYAWQASREEQIVVAERLLEVQGWRAWPACSRKLGLR